MNPAWEFEWDWEDGYVYYECKIGAKRVGLVSLAIKKFSGTESEYHYLWEMFPDGVRAKTPRPEHHGETPTAEVAKAKVEEAYRQYGGVQ
jgi:hypothetical protein